MCQSPFSFPLHLRPLQVRSDFRPELTLTKRGQDASLEDATAYEKMIESILSMYLRDWVRGRMRGSLCATSKNYPEEAKQVGIDLREFHSN